MVSQKILQIIEMLCGFKENLSCNESFIALKSVLMRNSLNIVFNIIWTGMLAFKDSV